MPATHDTVLRRARALAGVTEGRGYFRVVMILTLGWGALAVGARAALPVPATGANVDESRVTRILYVDPAHPEAADDDKHGAADAPFATLGFACQAAARAKSANVGVKIVLATGTYREAAEIPAPEGGKPDTDAPLVVEAAEREQAVIDGADSEGWSPSTWKVEGTRWTHPWPFRHATPPPSRLTKPPVEAAPRDGLVFIDGSLLRQLDEKSLLATSGTWGVVSASAGGRRGAAPNGAGMGATAVVQPPPDTELAGVIIQVGVRRRGLTITGRRNVVVRGLLIQHAAEPGGAGEQTAGLTLEGCSNVLVEDVLSQWNDGVGLTIRGPAGGGLPSADFTLRRVRLLHNAGSGLEAANVRNVLAEDNETSFNNFRGDWAGRVDPQGPAGVKLEAVRGSTWRRQRVVGNACRGMWWAGGDTAITVEDAVLRGNVVSGLFVDNDPGPAAVSRCLVSGTRAPPGSGGGPENPVACAGVSVAGTPDVTLQSNVFADNAGTQLGLGEPFGKPLAHAERHTSTGTTSSTAPTWTPASCGHPPPTATPGPSRTSTTPRSIRGRTVSGTR